MRKPLEHVLKLLSLWQIAASSPVSVEVVAGQLDGRSFQVCILLFRC